MRKFILYVLSGLSAATVDIGIYLFLLWLGAWYITANITAGILAFFTAFLLNKFIVFGKSDHFFRHLRRYFLVDMTNLLIITTFLYLLVHFALIDPKIAKFIALAPMVLWNFFVYKLFVYV